MSLPSSRALRLSIGKDRVHASALSGRWRPRLVAESSVAADLVKAEAPAAMLRQVLNDLASRTSIRGCRLEVELADSMLHFDIVAGDFAGWPARRLMSLAQASATELLGERAESHLVRWQLQRDEHHLLVCALPKPWMDALTEAAGELDLRLDGVRPVFARQWNRLLAGQRPAQAVFVVAEGSRATIACVRNGAITALSSGPWLADREAHESSDASFIDMQVDRLLAGLGIAPDVAMQWLFVGASTRLSKRWHHHEA